MSQTVQKTSDQLVQERFMHLSQQFKTPLRTAFSETEEIVQTTITNLVKQLAQMSVALDNANEKILTLQERDVPPVKK